MEPPSMLHTGDILNGPKMDLSEVCIFDPQNGKTILVTFETSNHVPCLKMLVKNCKSQTVKHILSPLNTSDPSIVKYGGAYWMLTELDLTTDEVHIYDWRIGKDLDDYNMITGLLLSLQPVPHCFCVP
jgi:hypothetical protein